MATGAVGNTRYLNTPVGLQLRWALLVELAVLALAYAVVSRRRALARLAFPASLAVALTALAAASALWSPHARLTLERSGSLILLGAAVVGIACGCAGHSRTIGRLLLGLAAGASVVALAGLVVLALRPAHAAVHANVQSPWRYNGLGANPNTVPMVLALAMPAAAWSLVAARSRAWRTGAAATIVLFAGSIAASGSRGALAGALVGTLPLALAAGKTWRRRALLTGSTAAAFLVLLGVMQIPQPASAAPSRPLGAQELGKHRDAEPILPLENEICLPKHGEKPYRRTLFSSGGRFCAWRGAVEQAVDRPILGYGFGTEERVFVDRYHLFLSSRVENSYLGTLLQLGAAGLVLLLALIGGVLARACRALPRLSEGRLEVAAACAGIVLCGLVLALSQSYLTSVGSPATLPFWLGLFLLAAASVDSTAPPPLPSRSRGSA